MDVIRRSSTTSMYTWGPDQPPTKVVWFRAPEGAAVFPGAHCFPWHTAELDNGYIDGEPLISDVWKNRYDTPPALYKGEAPDGRLEAFQTGGVRGVDEPIITDANGAPPGCLAGRQMAGGSVEGGAFAVHTPTPMMAGGEVEGGAFPVVVPVAYRMAGGEVEGGAFPLLTPTLYRMAGGEVEGGRFSTSTPFLKTMAGGEVEGGAFPSHTGFAVRMAGGSVEGGAGLVVVPLAVRMAGGEVEGGAAGVTVPLKSRMAGGEVEGGAFTCDTLQHARAALMGGGEVEGGRFPTSAGVRMAGGSVEGGTFPPARGFGVVMAGGSVEGGAFPTARGFGVVMAGGEVEGGAMGSSDMIPGTLILIDKSYVAAQEMYPNTSTWSECATKQRITFTLAAPSTVLLTANVSFVNGTSGSAEQQVGVLNGATTLAVSVVNVPYANGYCSAALTGFVDLPAGTYTLTLQFWGNAGTPYVLGRSFEVFRVF